MIPKPVISVAPWDKYLFSKVEEFLFRVAIDSIARKYALSISLWEISGGVHLGSF